MMLADGRTTYRNRCVNEDSAACDLSGGGSGLCRGDVCLSMDPDAGPGPDAHVPMDGYVAPDAATCPPGTVLGGGVCEVIPAPRLISPLSGSTAMSRRPTFRWELALPATGGRLEVCRDRACTMVELTLDVTGTSAAPGAPLAAGLHYWRVRGSAGGAVGSGASATWPVTLANRMAASDASWDHNPDYDGNGTADVVGGAYYPASAPGSAFVYAGPPLPVSPSVRLTGAGGAGGFFGYDACSGDVDGDGYSDLVVGSQGAVGRQGRVYVYRGGSTGLREPASYVLTSPSMCLGQGLSCEDDLNADGFADIAAGHNGGSGCPRVVDVYFGSAGGPGTVPSASLSVSVADFGSSLAMGDVNGDEYADLFVAAGSVLDGYAGGGVYVYLGAPTSSFPTTHATRTSSYGSDIQRVAYAGDVNGDRFGDLVVSGYAPPFGGGDVGRFHVHLGGGTGITATPTGTVGVPSGSGVTVGFGAEVASAGDVNGDGLMDVLISDPYAPASGDRRYGAAWVYFGTNVGSLGVSAEPSVPLMQYDGVNAYFGIRSSGGGDVDGDGYADVVVASHGDDLLGHLHLFRGGRAGTSSADSWRVAGPDGAGAYFSTPLL